MGRWPHEGRDQEARAVECYVTDHWVMPAILRHELLPPRVWDPCCGDGRLVGPLLERGSGVEIVVASDIIDWRHEHDGIEWGRVIYRCPADLMRREQWPASVLTWEERPESWGVVMNPPFGRSEEMCRKALCTNARKVVVIQRSAFFHSLTRRPFWAQHPPTRVWQLVPRPLFWLINVPPAARNTSMKAQDYSVFVWERGQVPAQTMGVIERDV